MLDVALNLLKRYENLVREASSPKSVNKDLPGESSESSALVALAKLHHSFPSSNRFSYGEQFIYDSKFLKFVFIYFVEKKNCPYIH